MGAERYGLALILILASMVFIMASSDSKWAEVVALNLQAFALLASGRAAQPSIQLRVVVGAIIVLAIVAAWIMAAFTNDLGEDFVRLATLALVLVATPVIVAGLIRQVRLRGKITVHTMMGVLCIYLLMCLAFAAAFAAIAAISGEPFFQQGAAVGTTNNYLYYSITTVTTVGLGDFSPATNLGRSLTAAEALIGQIYVLTVVAVIVGNLGRSRKDG